MLKLIFLLVLSTGAWAERLILSGFADLKSNLLFSQLEQYKGTSQTQAEAVATANAANCVLSQLALNITLLPSYLSLIHI